MALPVDGKSGPAAVPVREALTAVGAGFKQTGDGLYRLVAALLDDVSGQVRNLFQHPATAVTGMVAGAMLVVLVLLAIMMVRHFIVQDPAKPHPAKPQQKGPLPAPKTKNGPANPSHGGG